MSSPSSAATRYRVEPIRPALHVDLVQPEGEREPPVAILVAHGMGQQIKFQTLDDVAEGLLADDRRRRKGPQPAPVARTVMLGQERLQRLELTLQTRRGTERAVHVYEAYWAPLTEGRVTLRDVTRFLFRSGGAGIALAWRPFRRWLFDRYETFSAPTLTALHLLAALAVVAALAVLNALILAMAAARVPLSDPPAWLTDGLFRDFTTVLNAWSLALLPLAVTLGVSMLRTRKPRRTASTWAVCTFVVAVAATGGAALAAIGLAFVHTREAHAPLSLRLPATLRDVLWWGHGVTWPIVIAVSAVVRRFLIQYAGDVAAYVQPQVLDRFFSLRERIKDRVWRTARAVYAEEAYAGVILVGHSLGSVVIYDVLNKLLLDRALGCPDAPDVASRTRLLVTFGSPLDKTAFIFGTQGTGSEAREALAASLQPLINDESVRPPWVNIYSPSDIISGRLDYYDRPDRSNRRPVRNLRDPLATTWLAAHVEYWKNPLLFRTIARHL